MDNLEAFTFVVYHGDAVAKDTLSLLEKAGCVKNAAFLDSNAKLPERVIVLKHRPNQRGYVMIEGARSPYLVHVRPSNNGKTGRSEKAFLRIPDAIMEREEQPLRLR